jgi:hypothetical protein
MSSFIMIFTLFRAIKSTLMRSMCGSHGGYCEEYGIPGCDAV